MYPKSYFGGNQHRNSLDSVENLLEAFEEALRAPETTSSFPHYDIIERNPDNYCIQVALAGYKKDNIEVVMENGKLTISGKNDGEEEEGTYLKRGIAKRKFHLEFRLGRHICVERADFVEGILTVSLMRLVPDDEKPKQIPVF